MVKTHDDARRRAACLRYRHGVGPGTDPDPGSGANPGANASTDAGTGIGSGAGQARTTIPPYSERTPDTKPLGSHVGQPEINPSAAGTVRERDKGASQTKTGEDSGEHSGSIGSNANTHPLKSLRARGQPRQEGMTEPSGVYPPPHSTMNRDAGESSSIRHGRA